MICDCEYKGNTVKKGRLLSLHIIKNHGVELIYSFEKEFVDKYSNNFKTLDIVAFLLEFYNSIRINESKIDEYKEKFYMYLKSFICIYKENNELFRQYKFIYDLFSYFVEIGYNICGKSFKNCVNKVIEYEWYKDRKLRQIKDNFAKLFLSRYYRKYLQKDEYENICKICGGETNFSSLSLGFTSSCSLDCKNDLINCKLRAVGKEKRTSYQYKCFLCEEAFKRENDLMEHIKRVHIKFIEEQRELKKGYCRLCKKPTNIKDVNLEKKEVSFFKTCPLHEKYEIIIDDFKL